MGRKAARKAEPRGSDIYDLESHRTLGTIGSGRLKADSSDINSHEDVTTNTRGLGWSDLPREIKLMVVEQVRSDIYPGAHFFTAVDGISEYSRLPARHLRIGPWHRGGPGAPEPGPWGRPFYGWAAPSCYKADVSTPSNTPERDGSWTPSYTLKRDGSWTVGNRSMYLLESGLSLVSKEMRSLMQQVYRKRAFAGAGPTTTAMVHHTGTERQIVLSMETDLFCLDYVTGNLTDGGLLRCFSDTLIRRLPLRNLGVVFDTTSRTPFGPGTRPFQVQHVGDQTRILLVPEWLTDVVERYYAQRIWFISKYPVARRRGAPPLGPEPCRFQLGNGACLVEVRPDDENWIRNDRVWSVIRHWLEYELRRTSPDQSLGLLSEVQERNQTPVRGAGSTEAQDPR